MGPKGKEIKKKEVNSSVDYRPEQRVPHPRSSRHKQIFSSETKGQMGRPLHQERCRHRQVPGGILAVLPIPGSLKGRYGVTLKPWHSFLYTKTPNMALREGLWEYFLATKYIPFGIIHLGWQWEEWKLQLKIHMYILTYERGWKAIYQNV